MGNRIEVRCRMWQMLLDAADREPGRTVRIAKLADDHLPVPHKQWVTQVVREWENADYVRTWEGGAKASLTKRGAAADLPPGA